MNEKMNRNEDERKAAIMIKGAAVKAALLVKEATVKAAILPKDAAEKAELLVKNAAEKAALLPKMAAVKAALLPKRAAEKAILLLKEAAAKAAQLPQDASEKSSLLLNVAAENALLLLNEEAGNLAAEKNKFLDIAAHELRNPIASVSLLLQILEKQIDRGQVVNVDVVKKLRSPVDRLSRLVVDLLNMSKLERGLFSPDFALTDINFLISECIEEFQLKVPERKFVFQSPAQPTEVVLDSLWIYQVLTNLLDNAVKYTKKGPIEVMLVDKTNCVRVSIKDYGDGITKDQLDVLFDVFSRGSYSAIVLPSGLGLGLSICKAIIDSHNGKIGVESEEGQGSTFYFELPKENLQGNKKI